MSPPATSLAEYLDSQFTNFSWTYDDVAAADIPTIWMYGSQSRQAAKILQEIHSKEKEQEPMRVLDALDKHIISYDYPRLFSSSAVGVKLLLTRDSPYYLLRGPQQDKLDGETLEKLEKDFFVIDSDQQHLFERAQFLRHANLTSLLEKKAVYYLFARGKGEENCWEELKKLMSPSPFPSKRDLVRFLVQTNVRPKWLNGKLRQHFSKYNDLKKVKDAEATAIREHSFE